jgi:general secretion pathway protein D
VDTALSAGVTVTLVAENGADVASAPMQIQFDPKVLRLNDVSLGDLLTQGGEQPVFTKNILNDQGTATIQLARPPGTPGVSGSGVLIALNFQAVGRGTTTVTIPNLAVRNGQGQVIATGAPQLTINVR